LTLFFIIKKLRKFEKKKWLNHGTFWDAAAHVGAGAELFFNTTAT
jgi:hypothetical protein